MSYYKFWNLDKPPFEMGFDPHFFFESNTHSEGLARLTYFVADKHMEMAALTGEIGSGKTTLWNLLKSKLDPNAFLVVNILTSNLDFESILQEINLQIRQEEFKGLNNKQAAPGTVNKYHEIKVFEGLLSQQIQSTHKHLLIIFDEAHFLDMDCLQEIKCLTNLNTLYQYAQMSILFLGQPQLKSKLRKLPEMYQRLGMFYHLNHLCKNEINDYINHRIEKASNSNPTNTIFEPSCVDSLYEFSKGCPRQINRVCKLAIDQAAFLKKPVVSSKMVSAIVNDINKHFG